MPDFYSEAASVNDRASVSQAPNEVVDPFSGTLNIVHNDVVIPGNGGFDLVIKRVYSSQNVFVRQGIESTLQHLQTRTPYGIGWSMHFGRVTLPKTGQNGNASCGTPIAQDDVTDNPILETQDGKQMQLFCNDYPSTYDTNADFITKDHWVADYLSSNSNSSGFLVISPEGIRYTMDFRVRNGDGNYVFYPTRVQDRNGNYFTITYDSRTQVDSQVNNILYDRIRTNDGRTVDFVYRSSTNENRVTLAQIKYGSRTWTYSFTKLRNYHHQGNGDFEHYFLHEVDLPGRNTGEWNYTYYDRNTGAAGNYTLQRITYPYGATNTYDYKYHCFMYTDCSDQSRYNSLVVKSKVQGGRSIASGTWTYTYSEANTFDTTTVVGPTRRETYKHYGLYHQRSKIVGVPSTYGSQNDNLWRVGLLAEKRTLTTSGNLVQLEEYTYNSRRISSEFYSRFPYTNRKAVSDPDVFLGYLTQKKVTRNNKTYTTTYSNFNDNINPHRITESGQSTRVTNLDYYPRRNGQNIVHQVDDENVGSGTNRRITRTFDNDGNLRTENKYGVLTTYTYDSQGNISSVKDARNKITRLSSYYRGVARTENRPEGITIRRGVDNNGNVTSITNGRGNTTGYGYDSINRLTSINYPLGSNAGISWGSTTRTLTRGGYRQVVTFDGFGRTICTKNENIFIGQAYNAAGNKRYETYPNYSGCSSASRTSFTYDPLDRLVRSTHVDGRYNENTYQNNNRVRYRNERGHYFYHDYRSYSDPDQKSLIRVSGPENLNVTVGRNVLDQVTSINRNGVNRTYGYGSSIFLTSETNPETGTTTYGRDAVGNMTSRKVGASGTTLFDYDDINRLKLINYPGSTPDVNYTYDKNDNVETVNSGIANIRYTYDPNDNLKQERQTINNRNYFLTYNYNSIDHLSSLTYADAGTVTYAPNDLGWPTKAAPYVTGVSYNAFGQPTSISYQNGRTQTQSYWARHWPRRTIVNGGIADRERTNYDGIGNVRTIDDRLNNQQDRTLSYDQLNRLSGANGPWGNGSISYSTDDDIDTKNMGTNRFTYSYSNNRVSRISGLPSFITPAIYGYDAYGNITRKSNSSYGWTYQYDNASNLRKVFEQGGSLLRTYDYSGNKQRVRSIKEGEEERVHIVNKEGQILNEFVISGDKPNITNVYLGSRLVAELEGAGQPSTPATVYGWGYGNSQNKYSYSSSFTLNELPDRIKFCVDGYGINSSTEVSVRINGTLIGYLKPGSDPKETCFEVEASLLRVGTNTIVFTQSSPGQTWGVTKPDITVINDGGFLPAIFLLLLDDED